MENRKVNNHNNEFDLANNENDYAKEVRKDYYKNWRDNNKDKIKKYNSNYWQKRAKKLKQNSNTTK